MNRILESIVERSLSLEAAYRICNNAVGRGTGIVDQVLVGKVDDRNLVDFATKTERYTDREMRTLLLPASKFDVMAQSDALILRLELWGESHGTASLPHA